MIDYEAIERAIGNRVAKKQRAYGDSFGQAHKVLQVLYPDGKEIPPSTFHFNEENGRCHDCNIIHGNYHHPGCDVERCPRCDGQLISCGCLDPETYKPSEMEEEEKPYEF